MRMYGDAGDTISPLIEDLVSCEDSLYFDWDKSASKTDLAEILIKGAAFELFHEGKISKQSRDIFLYSIGIDEYYPRLSAKEMSRKYGISNLSVRSIRFHTARKILKVINLEI